MASPKISLRIVVRLVLRDRVSIKKYRSKGDQSRSFFSLKINFALIKPHSVTVINSIDPHFTICVSSSHPKARGSFEEKCR